MNYYRIIDVLIKDYQGIGDGLSRDYRPTAVWSKGGGLALKYQRRRSRVAE